MIPADLYGRYTTALTENDRQARAALAAIVAQLDPADVDGVRDALLEAYPALVKLYGTRAAQVALEFYTGVRDAQGVTAWFVPMLPAESEIYDEVEAVADVRREVGNLYSGKSTLEAFTSTMQGLATKRTMRMADDTIYALADADPAHPKAAFVPSAGACAWCMLMGSRGFTNTRQAAENFRHNHCRCAVVMDFDTKNPALEGYDPADYYAAYEGFAYNETFQKMLREEWDAMDDTQRAKYVRRTRDRAGNVVEHPGDWTTFVRNRTVQEMNVNFGNTKNSRISAMKEARGWDFDAWKRGEAKTPSLAAGGMVQAAGNAATRGTDPEMAARADAILKKLGIRDASSRVSAVEKENPRAYEEWRDSVSRVDSLKTSQSLRQHVPGTKEHERADSKSYFYVDESLPVEKRVESTRELINGYAGTGSPIINRNGDWSRKEHVRCDGIIGVDGWSNTETSSMTIYYGDDKVHASPRYDGNGRSLDED